MPKAILEFDLTDVEEAREFAIVQKSQKFYGILWDFDQWLRGELKYKELPEEVHRALQEARDKLNDIMAKHDVAFVD